MKIYICEICGDAYIGSAKPKNCPFCGAEGDYIKDGNEAEVITVQDFNLDDISKKNLETTLVLEVNATALYLCMAEKAETGEVKAMYKRLAKVEKEHAGIARKFLGINALEVPERQCGDTDVENFKQTIALEKNATRLYNEFIEVSSSEPIKKFFTALAVVEKDHIELIEKYLD